MLDDGDERHERFAHRVSTRIRTIYLKMVLGRDFADIMDYAEIAAEKCGDVVEMWLGTLHIANMTKSQIILYYIILYSWRPEPIRGNCSQDYRGINQHLPWNDKVNVHIQHQEDRTVPG